MRVIPNVKGKNARQRHLSTQEIVEAFDKQNFELPSFEWIKCTEN